MTPGKGKNCPLFSKGFSEYPLGTSLFAVGIGGYQGLNAGFYLAYIDTGLRHKRFQERAVVVFLICPAYLLIVRAASHLKEGEGVVILSSLTTILQAPNK